MSRDSELADLAEKAQAETGRNGDDIYWIKFHKPAHLATFALAIAYDDPKQSDDLIKDRPVFMRGYTAGLKDATPRKQEAQPSNEALIALAEKHFGSYAHQARSIFLNFASDYRTALTREQEAQPAAQEPSIDAVLALAKRYAEQAANIWRTYKPHSLGEFIELREFRQALTDALASQPPSAQEPSTPEIKAAMRDWALERWHAEVANRPLINVHRRALDDTWRQVLRYLGVDDRMALGPTHDELRAKYSANEWEAMMKGSK